MNEIIVSFGFVFINKSFDLSFEYLIKTICGFTPQKQFDHEFNKVFYVDALLVGPIVEELIFTHLISRKLGSVYGPIISSMLFGFFHYHNHIKTWAFQSLLFSTTFYFKQVIYHKMNRPKLFPILTHSMANIVALFCIHHINN